MAKTKLQAALSDPELRRALRITPPEGAPLEGVLAVVVSNNPYEFARLDRLGQRHRLDAGMLQISVFDASTLDELVERLLVGHCPAPSRSVPLYATGCPSTWRWASWREGAGRGRRRADHFGGPVALLGRAWCAARAPAGRTA